MRTSRFSFSYHNYDGNQDCQYQLSVEFITESYLNGIREKMWLNSDHFQTCLFFFHHFGKISLLNNAECYEWYGKPNQKHFELSGKHVACSSSVIRHCRIVIFYSFSLPLFSPILIHRAYFLWHILYERILEKYVIFIYWNWYYNQWLNDDCRQENGKATSFVSIEGHTPFYACWYIKRRLSFTYRVFFYTRESAYLAIYMPKNSISNHESVAISM